MEIEIKAKIDDEKKIKKLLLDMGTIFDYEEEQTDTYYKQKGMELEPQKPGSNVLRIRKTANGNFLTYKELTDKKGAWIEHDLEISNPEEMENILKKVNYVPVLTIHKNRTAGKLNGIKICMDDIKGLGQFIECEIHSENVEDVKSKILELITKLNIPEENIEHKGYARILFEKQGVKYLDGDDKDDAS